MLYNSKRSSGCHCLNYISAAKIVDKDICMGSRLEAKPESNNNKTVMVIDDDRVYLDWLDQVLTEEGYKVVLHDDGPSAVEHVRRVKPNLVILDLMLPEVGGWTILNQL